LQHSYVTKALQGGDVITEEQARVLASSHRLFRNQKFFAIRTDGFSYYIVADLCSHKVHNNDPFVRRLVTAFRDKNSDENT